MQADFSPMLASPASARQYAETQFEIIKRYVLAFQAALDEDHDVGVLLSSFGTNVLMEIGFNADWPGKQSTPQTL